MPLGTVNYGVSKQYAGSQVSGRCQLGYLIFIFYRGDLIASKMGVEGIHTSIPMGT